MSFRAVGGELRRVSENAANLVTHSVITTPGSVKEFFAQAGQMKPGFILQELSQMGRVFSEASKLIKERKADANDVTPSFAGAVWLVMNQDLAKPVVKNVKALTYQQE